jgi:hypothetical protein
MCARGPGSEVGDARQVAAVLFQLRRRARVRAQHRWCHHQLHLPAQRCLSVAVSYRALAKLLFRAPRPSTAAAAASDARSSVHTCIQLRWPGSQRGRCHPRRDPQAPGPVLHTNIVQFVDVKFLVRRILVLGGSGAKSELSGGTVITNQAQWYSRSHHNVPGSRRAAHVVSASLMQQRTSSRFSSCDHANSDRQCERSIVHCDKCAPFAYLLPRPAALHISPSPSTQEDL